MKQKLLTLVLFVVLGMLVSTSVSFAVDVGNDGIIWYEDGSHLIYELRVDDEKTTYATNQISGEKTARFYNSNNELLWTFAVQGTFTYNGVSAVATSATYSYVIYDSTWRFRNADAYCSGNQAVADGEFSRGLFVSREVEVALACSSNGNLF